MGYYYFKKHIVDGDYFADQLFHKKYTPIIVYYLKKTSQSVPQGPIANFRVEIIPMN